MRMKAAIKSLISILLLAGPAGAQDAEPFALERYPVSDAPCRVTFNDTSPPFFLSLAHRKDGSWNLRLFVEDAGRFLRPYFDQNGLFDRDKLHAAIPELTFGGQTVAVRKAWAAVVEIADIETRDTFILEVDSPAAIRTVLRALPSDTLELGNLISYTGLQPGLQAFGLCSEDAMGESAATETDDDYLTELRLAFETALEGWVEQQSIIDNCTFRDSSADFQIAMENGAAAFFPGSTDGKQARSWMSSMEMTVANAKLRGSVSALRDVCSSAHQFIADGYRALTEKAIIAAKE